MYHLQIVYYCLILLFKLMIQRFFTDFFCVIILILVMMPSLTTACIQGFAKQGRDKHTLIKKPHNYMQIIVNYGSFHCKMLLALQAHSRNNVVYKVFYLSPPSHSHPLALYLSFTLCIIFISIFYFFPTSKFCTCLSFATFLISDSLSVVEVKSMKTGQLTCTTTVLHPVHWPAVSHIPAALLLRLVSSSLSLVVLLQH